jgi:peptide/nickel transport system substrate-binding protein
LLEARPSYSKEVQGAMWSKKSKRDVTRRDVLRMGSAVVGVGLVQAYGPAARPGCAAAPQPAAAAQSSEPKRGGTLTAANGASIVEFNPFSLGTNNLPFIRAMYNSLAHYDAQLNLQPELAESWRFSADGKTVTVKLREGVKFHTGREVVAEDVQASLKFAQNNEAATMRGVFRSVVKVDLLDKYTVVLTSATTNPSMFDMLDALYVIDRETIGDRGKMAVGTGAFKFDKYLPNDRVEMVAFNDYWQKGKPYLDRYILRIIPEPSTQAINLEAGAVDCVWRLPFTDLVRLQQAGKYVVNMGAAGSNVFDIWIQTKSNPLDDKRVRQAVAWSIDRARFCRTALQGLVEPTCLMWPPGSWAHFKDLEGRIGFDLNKAKALLKEAGLEKGFETEILTSSANGASWRALAEILQSDLRKIGVTARINDVEPAVYNTTFNNKPERIQLMVHTYGRANRDPGSLVTGARVWYSTRESPGSGFESAEYDKLRDELQSTVDREKRVPAARRIQEFALDQCFLNPIALDRRPWVHAPQVKGFVVDVENSPFVSDVWLEK